MRLGQPDLIAVSTALRELYSHLDAATLPHQIVRLLRRLVQADSAVYNSFDFRTGDMQVVHDHGSDGDRYLPVLNEHIQEHPLMVHVRAHWREGAAALSDVISKRQLRDTPIYREFLHPLRIEEQLGLLVDDREHAVLAVSLHRERSRFSGRDREVLTLFQPHILQAFKNASEWTTARRRCVALEQSISACDVGVIWLGEDSSVEWMSNKARDWMNAYFVAERSTVDGLPESAARWLARQRREWLRPDDLTSQRPLVTQGRRGRLTIRWVQQGPGGGFLSLSEQQIGGAREDLRVLGLTAREIEVHDWLSEGKSNDSIAIILGISRRTVEKHVESILAKLGVENRVEAVLAGDSRRV